MLEFFYHSVMHKRSTKQMCFWKYRNKISIFKFRSQTVKNCLSASDCQQPQPQQQQQRRRRRRRRRCVSPRTTQYARVWRAVVPLMRVPCRRPLVARSDMAAELVTGMLQAPGQLGAAGRSWCWCWAGAAAGTERKI